MINNIFNFALKCGEIDREVLCEMCDQMEPDMRTRFVEAILGIVDVPAIIAEIPSESKGRYASQGIRKFVSYNYLKDSVQYTYKETEKRWFASQDKADHYTETGCYNWGDSASSQKEGYEIEAEHTYDREGTCDLCDWNHA